MAADLRNSPDGSPKLPHSLSSESSYLLDESRDAREYDATKTTTLRGVGADDGRGDSGGDDWLAFEDFEDLPRWRRPSV
jgi:hypothetical protein